MHENAVSAPKFHYQFTKISLSRKNFIIKSQKCHYNVKMLLLHQNTVIAPKFHYQFIIISITLINCLLL